MIRIALRSAVAVATLCMATPSGAVDWSSCASSLASLRDRASGASSTAQEIEARMGALDVAITAYQNCRSMPALYDLAKDGCSSKKSDVETAQKNYDSALADMHSSLRGVNARVQNVSSSCEMNLGTPAAAMGYLSSLPPELRDKCSVYLRNTARIPKQELIGLCEKQYSAEVCMRCIP